jgi:alkylhydroperoxidase family enzyme
MFTGWMAAGRSALTSPVLPARLRELVILRTVYLMGSPYEIAQHTALARTIGISEEQMMAMLSQSDWEKADFDHLELAILRLTTELLTTRSVSVAVFDQVHRAVGAEATIEVLMIINCWLGLALMLNALDVDIDESARVSVPTTGGLRS